MYLALLALFAVGLGVFSDAGPQHPNRFYFVKELGAPWFALGFLGGRHTASPLIGAVTGTAVVGVALASFYLYVALTASSVSYGELGAISRPFLLMGAIVGPLLGVAGSFSTTSDRRAIGCGVLAGMILAEGVGIATNVGFLGGPFSMAVLDIVVALGISIACTVRGPSLWLPVTTLVTSAAALGGVSFMTRAF
jgi:hypothetical protein